MRVMGHVLRADGTRESVTWAAQGARRDEATVRWQLWDLRDDAGELVALDPGDTIEVPIAALQAEQVDA